MRLLVAWIFSLFAAGVTQAADTPDAASIPAENRVKGDRPSFEPATAMAKRLFEGLLRKDAGVASEVFFPQPEFVRLKSIKKPEDYHVTLIKEFETHFKRQLAVLAPYKSVAFVGFKAGSCKWKDVGSEYNSIPYWSCYRNQVSVKADGKTLTLPIKVMINWGTSWYVTHLGMP